MHGWTKPAVVVAALLLATGCGGSAPKKAADSPSTAPVSSVPSASASALSTEIPAGAAGAVAALKTYLNAFATNDAATACSLETAAFSRSQVTRAVQAKFLKKGGSCVQLIAKAIAEAKKQGGNLAALAKNQITVLDISPGKVTLRVAYPGSTAATPESYGLVQSGAAWLISSNDDLPNSN